MGRIYSQKLLVALLACLLGGVAPAFAAEEPLESLGFIEPAESVVATSRIPRPTSKIAENVTVVTAEDIARLNAHTLAEVLQTVPGIQLDHLGTPGTWTFFNIQGALNTTVLVLIDGIRQNDFQQNIATPGQIPVQNIERIEIVKGAASAAWGPALGGVINIITKSPDPERRAGGMVSGSIGSRFTADSRAEVSGAWERLGYYLTAGNLRSDGLTPNTDTSQNSLYGKLTYLLPSQGTATFGLSYLSAGPGLDEGDTSKWGFVHDRNQYRRANGFLKLSQPLAPLLTLDMDGYVTSRDDHTKYGGRDSQGAIVFFNDFQARESSRGTNVRLTWGDGQRNLAAGMEYGHARARSMDLLSGLPPASDMSWDSWGLYANGTYTIGALTILPGIRQDYTGISGDNTSYTLGLTYQLTDSTVLRGYAAKGFSLSNVAYRDNLQEVRTIQGGIETGAVPYLWLKGTYFYNALRNSQTAGLVPQITNQDRQGFEVEVRTTPFFGLSVAGGYTFMYAKDVDTGAVLKTDSAQSVPPHVVKLALNYDNADRGLRGVLTGSYVFWRNRDSFPPASGGTIWDLHLGWKPFPAKDLSPELFFSGHNLFNGNQTTDAVLFNSPSRWFEGGIKVRF